MRRATIFSMSAIWVLLLGTWAHAQVVASQTKYQPGESIVLTVGMDDVPEGAVMKQGIQVDVTGGSKSTIEQGPKPNVFHVWAAPGAKHYQVEVLGMWGVPHPKVSGAWLDFGLFRYRTSFSVQQGDDPPDPPDPGPNPPDPPKPGGPYQIMYFYPAGQRDNLPKGQQEILGSVKLRDQLVSKGHTILEILDSKAMGEPVKKEYLPFIEAAKGVELPAVAIAPKDGGRVVVQTLPKDVQGLLELLDSAKLGIVTTRFIGGKP